MTTQHVETLIIGAGQAGLSTGHHLQRLGRPFLIVDGNDRIGDNWRQQWDTLKLYSPAKYDGLPGLAFPAPPWSFPGKDEVADYLEKYAIHCDLPVRTSTRVDRLEAGPDGGFTATFGEDTITCDNVVVATGTFGRTPNVPDFAADLDPVDPAAALERVPASVPAQPRTAYSWSAPPTPAATSPTRLAEHLPTILVGPDRGQIPLRWDSRRIRAVFTVLAFVWRHVLTRRTPDRPQGDGRGPPPRRADAAGQARRPRAAAAWSGVLSRVAGVSDGRPVLDDGRVVDAATVVWCTGFRQVFDWIDLPVFGEDGWPEEYRGVVESAPGLFFCGLCLPVRVQLDGLPRCRS